MGGRINLGFPRIVLLGRGKRKTSGVHRSDEQALANTGATLNNNNMVVPVLPAFSKLFSIVAPIARCKTNWPAMLAKVWPLFTLASSAA